MKKYLLIIPIVLLLSSCNTGVETPENLLSKEDMVTILIDFHLEDAKAQAVVMNTKGERKLKGHIRKKVFDKHGVDSLSFTTSYDYYLKQIEQLNEIYAAVNDTIDTRVGNKKNIKKPVK